MLCLQAPATRRHRSRCTTSWSHPTYSRSPRSRAIWCGRFHGGCHRSICAGEPVIALCQALVQALKMRGRCLRQMIGIMAFAAVLAVAIAGAQTGSGGSSGPGASGSPRGPHRAAPIWTAFANHVQPRDTSCCMSCAIPCTASAAGMHAHGRCIEHRAAVPVSISSA